MDMKKITIAIDGYSSCGKSTLAKQLAKELHYIFIDSGAMYRGITLFALQNDCISDEEVNSKKLIPLLDGIELHFQLNPKTNSPELQLNGKNVEGEIRTPKISSLVSKISSIREVREKLVKEQRKMGQSGGIVMDGRDIGSVVFPNAELKIFVTAEIETRTERRFSELSEKGIATTREEVQKNLIERDHLDSTRAMSPLKQTEDAIVIDNTHISREEQLKVAIGLVEDILLAK
jgi:cytidylate kinase